MQFTTELAKCNINKGLFQRAKIQDFRCNSQLGNVCICFIVGLFQRAKIQDFRCNSQPKLEKLHFPYRLFQRAKIQDFRCNSQPKLAARRDGEGCFKEQRYKILDAIHNLIQI